MLVANVGADNTSIYNRSDDAGGGDDGEATVLIIVMIEIRYTHKV